MNAHMKIASKTMQIANNTIGASRRFALAVVAAGVIALAPAAYAQSADAPSTSIARVASSSADVNTPANISREYLIKAAILYNLAKFTVWPEGAFSSANAPVRICVLGDDPFGPALESLHGKEIGGRPLVTASISNIDTAATCHIMFISGSEQGRLQAILKAVAGLPVLTVADMGEFATAGGIVGIAKAEGRSQIKVNIGAADQAGVKLSSKLLRLAARVGSQTAHIPAAPK